MAPIPEPTRPIIVCGMPRTGTTLLGQLVKTAGWDTVVMFPEFSPEQVPALFDVVEQTRDMFRWQTWRGFSDEQIEARVVDLFRRIIGSGRDPEPGGDDVGQPRFGFKEPRAEIRHERFSAALAGHRPQYVYTFRDPIDSYRSFIDVSVDPPRPKEFAEWLDESSRAAVAIGGVGDLFPVDVERWSANGGLRTEMAERLFSFLDLRPTAETARFVARWPSINRRQATGREFPAVAELARRHRQLAHYRERTASLPVP